MAGNREFTVRPDGSIVGLRPDGTTVGLTLAEAVQAQQERARILGHQAVSAGKAPAAVNPTAALGQGFIRAVLASGKDGAASGELQRQLNLATVNALSASVRAAYRLVQAQGVSKDGINKYLWKKRSTKRGQLWFADAQKLKGITLP